MMIIVSSNAHQIVVEDYTWGETVIDSSNSLQLVVKISLTTGTNDTSYINQINRDTQ
jgi:hypothetical protein